jgi:hypothetical protein
MNSPRRRWTPILMVVTLAAAAVIAVPSVREPVLQAAGWALVLSEQVAPADIIVISPDSGGAGALEAAAASAAVGLSLDRQIFVDARKRNTWKLP